MNNEMYENKASASRAAALDRVRESEYYLDAISAIHSAANNGRFSLFYPVVNPERESLIKTLIADGYGVVGGNPNGIDIKW